MRHILSALIICWLISSATSVRAADPRLVIEPGGHTRLIKELIFTKDGSHLISVADDNVVRVWSMTSGKLVRLIYCQSGVGGGTIFAAALSPDDSLLAVGGIFSENPEDSFAVRLYDFQTGKLKGLLKGHNDRVVSLAFSADGRHLASGGGFNDKRILVWEVAAAPSASPIELEGHTDAVSTLAFSPAGTLLASGGDDNTVRFWDWAQKTEKSSKKLHSAEVYGLAFSPNGRYLASGGLDKKIYLWDMQSDATKELARMDNDVLSVAFSPDGQRILAGAKRGDCKFFSVESGKVLGSCRRDEDSILAAAFSPDRKLAATTGGFNGEIFIWKTESFESASLVGKGQTVWSVGFSPDGKSIAFGNKRTSDMPNKYGPLEQQFNLQQGESYKPSLGTLVKQDMAFVRSLEKAGDYELKTRYGEKIGKETITFDRELQVLKNNRLHRIIKLTSITGRMHKSYTLTSDGRYVVSGGENGRLTLYSTETGEMITNFAGHTNDVWAVAVSPDNRLLVSGSSDQTVKLWDIKSGENLLTIFVASDYEWVAWTPGGYYTSSLGGDRYFGWLLKPTGEESLQFYSAAQFQKTFYRPDVVSEYLKTRDIQIAVRDASTAKGLPPLFQSIYNFKSMLLIAPPPKVQVIAPSSKESTVSEKILNVKLLVTSKTQPITDVNIYLNGVRKGTFQGDPGKQSESKSMEIEMQVSLEPGANLLSIVAANKRATAKPEILKINYQQPSSRLFNPATPVEAAKSVRPEFQRVSYARAAEAAEGCGPEQALNEAATAMVSTPDRAATIIISKPEGRRIVAEEALDLGGYVVSSKPYEVKISLDGALQSNISVGDQFSIPILPTKEGKSLLRITVSNESGVSEPILKCIDFRPRLAPKPNLIFLGIGISTYETFKPNLDFADDDAVDLSKAMETQKGNSLYNEVKTKVISNDEAKREGILGGLDWLDRETKYDNDVRVVLISGHGGISEGGSYYLYTHNHHPANVALNSISVEELLRQLGKRRNRTFLFLDACRSGNAALTEFIKNNLKGDLIVFAASGPNQPSLEKSEFGHGAFTQALLEGLRDGQANLTGGWRPTEANSQIDSVELGEYVAGRVVEITNGAQTPTTTATPPGVAIFSIQPRQ